MMGKLISQVKKFYWTYYFKKFCRISGHGLIVTGSVKINSIGEISCGDNLLIRTNRFDPVKIHVAANARLRIGSKVFLNNRVHISCSNKIIIGNHVDFGEDCLIMDNDFHSSDNSQPKIEPIIINDNVWIASRVIILKGVTIGQGAVIGAGSVVTKSIPPNSFAAGNPARIIKHLLK